MIDWYTELIKDMECFTDIHGNEIYPIRTSKQWVKYNILLYENETGEIITEEQIAELIDFWKFTTKKCKSDNVVLCLFYNESDDIYNIMAYYKDKIKNIKRVGGEVIDE